LMTENGGERLLRDCRRTFEHIVDIAYLCRRVNAWDDRPSKQLDSA
jgi:hypothetical protein